MSARITLIGVIFCVFAFFMNGQETNRPASGSAKATVVHGIDVSHFQGEINWDQVKQNKPKITFAFIKATEGTDMVDSQFESNWDGAKKAGVLRGAYHFFDAKLNSKAQAEFFIDTVKKLQENDLPPWLDLESGKFDEVDEIAKKKFVDDVFIWLETVENELGVRPLIYASPDFARDYLTDERFSDYSLVVAEYGIDTESPRMLGAWAGKTWAFWQYFPQRLIKGITEKTDMDKFHGSAETLLKFTKSSPAEKEIAYADLEKEKEHARKAIERQQESIDQPEEDPIQSNDEISTPDESMATEEPATSQTEEPIVKESPETEQWEKLPAVEEIIIGKTRFPKDFVYKKAEFKKGIYQVKLTWKEGDNTPYFEVSDKDGQLLFAEVGLIINRKNKAGNFKHRVKRTLLPGHEYFMIKVIKPERDIYAFFLVKK